MAQTANLYTPLFKKLDIFPRRQSVWFPFVKYHYPNMTASEVNTGLVLFCFDYFRQITQLIGKKNMRQINFQFSYEFKMFGQ